MKIALAVLTAFAAMPALAAPTGSQLAGVSDEETTISYGNIQQFERGHGDVLFVRDAADRWYRLGLNRGCLKGPLQLRSAIFRNQSSDSRIDRFTFVEFPDDLRTCAIRSIRRSAPPPQVDSHSPVTLD